MVTKYTEYIKWYFDKVLDITKLCLISLKYI